MGVVSRPLTCSGFSLNQQTMRLVGAMVVQDAADIVEAFVRHNLTLLDGLAIVDHASGDGTTEILAALVAERLPVFVARDESRGSISADSRTAWFDMCLQPVTLTGFSRSIRTNS